VHDEVIGVRVASVDDVHDLWPNLAEKSVDPFDEPRHRHHVEAAIRMTQLRNLHDLVGFGDLLDLSLL
jgi:hypothetical protein